MYLEALLRLSNIYVGAICEKSGEKAVIYFSKKSSIIDV